jgi:hypothetical protein
MAEPTIVLKINENIEATPTWTAIGTAIRWVGPDASAGDLTDPFVAPIADGDDAFFDNAASPNDGELWHDTTTDVQITVAGRNTNQNVFQADETGGTDATADPPELSAYDDATDASNRTAPTVWLLAGTAGSSTISVIRGVETTAAAGGAGWTGQVHDTTPGGGTSGEHFDGDKTGEKEVCATVLAANGTKEFNLAACAPHDSTSGETSYVYAFQYTYQ